MKVNDSKCVGCGICSETCPVDAIEFKNNKAEIITTRCIKCRMCMVACAHKAISM
ncbi:MAG: 4Fe-4S binding protein [Clostridia bacterium]|nr:4Fe-4S binding protein [Clostridia bacterium]